MPERRVPGRSAVTRRAITDIVRSAVLGSYGIAGFASPRPVDRLIRWLRLDEPAIRIRYDEGLSVALHVRVAYGLPIAEVARQVDSAVRFSVGRALGRSIDTLTIHVDGLDDVAGGTQPAVGTHDLGEPSADVPTATPDATPDLAPTPMPDPARDLVPNAAPAVQPGNGRGANGLALEDTGPAGQTQAARTGGRS